MSTKSLPCNVRERTANDLIDDVVSRRESGLMSPLRTEDSALDQCYASTTAYNSTY